MPHALFIFPEKTGIFEITFQLKGICYFLLILFEKKSGKKSLKSGQSVKGQEICVKVLARNPEKSAAIC